MSKNAAFLCLFGSIAWLIFVPFIFDAFGVRFSNPAANLYNDEPINLFADWRVKILTGIWLGGFSILFVTGSTAWGQAKGYDETTGFCLGFFLGPIGLLILTLLPDKSVASDAPEYSCPNCENIVRPNARGEAKCSHCGALYRFQ